MPETLNFGPAVARLLKVMGDTGRVKEMEVGYRAEDGADRDPEPGEATMWFCRVDLHDGSSYTAHRFGRTTLEHRHAAIEACIEAAEWMGLNVRVRIVD